MAKENEELDDQTLFDEAVADEQEEAPVTEVVAEPEKVEAAPEPVKAESQQDDKPEPEAETDDDKIPQWRRAEMAEATRQAKKDAEENARLLGQERTERLRIQQELDALRKPAVEPKKADKPDPLIDPDAYEAYLENKVEQRLLNDRRETSLRTAHGKYGKEFDEAYAIAQRHVDEALKAKMQQSHDPGETLIQWHREQKTMREVGTDPNAWLEKKLEERLKDPAFLAKAVELARGSAAPVQANGRPNVKLPPSLNSASRANAAVRGSIEDVPDDQLFDDITAA